MSALLHGEILSTIYTNTIGSWEKNESFLRSNLLPPNEQPHLPQVRRIHSEGKGRPVGSPKSPRAGPRAPPDPVSILGSPRAPVEPLDSPKSPRARQGRARWIDELGGSGEGGGSPGATSESGLL